MSKKQGQTVFVDFKKREVISQTSHALKKGKPKLRPMTELEQQLLEKKTSSRSTVCDPGHIMGFGMDDDGDDIA